MLQLRKFKIKYLLYFILYFSVFYPILLSVLGVPTVFRYLVDFVLIFTYIYMFFSKKKNIISKIDIIQIWFIMYVVFLLIAYAANYQSLAYLLWGLKNNLRYFVFFFLCIEIFREDDVKYFLKFINILFYVNMTAIIIEYFVFHLRGDYLGGLFGISKGCNGYLNVFLVIYTILITMDYIVSRTLSLTKFGIHIGIIVIVSAMCELKIIFFELALILFIALIQNGISLKKMMVFLGAGTIMYFGYLYMMSLFEYSVNVFNREGFLGYTLVGGYSTGALEFNRLNFVSMANTYILDTPLKRLIGLGIGNCDYSNLSIFMTPFSQQYSDMHYTWFMSVFTYLEQGGIGLFLYLSFFVFCFLKNRKTKKVNDVYYEKIGQIMSILSILLIFYNQSMREDMAFYVYFIIAMSYIMQKSK